MCDFPEKKNIRTCEMSTKKFRAFSFLCVNPRITKDYLNISAQLYDIPKLTCKSPKILTFGSPTIFDGFFEFITNDSIKSGNLNFLVHTLITNIDFNINAVLPIKKTNFNQRGIFFQFLKLIYNFIILDTVPTKRGYLQPHSNIIKLFTSYDYQV